MCIIRSGIVVFACVIIEKHSQLYPIDLTSGSIFLFHTVLVAYSISFRPHLVQMAKLMGKWGIFCYSFDLCGHSNCGTMLKKNTKAEKHAASDAEHLAAVQALFVDYLPAVRSLVLALWPDFDGANDIIQETFLTVTRKAADFKLGSDFAAWAATIARYKVKEAWKTKHRTFEAISPEVIESLMSSRPEGEHRQVELAALTECMRRLSPKACAIVEMRYEQSHSLMEIGTRIGWTAGSVHVALSRARMLLRDCINSKVAQSQ